MKPPLIAETVPTERRRLSPKRCPIAIEVPTRVQASGFIELSARDRHLFTFDLVLRASEYRYGCHGVTVVATRSELDSTVLRDLQIGSLVSAALTLHPPVVVHGDADSTDIAALWLLGRFSGKPTNVYIAERLGVSPQAAAQRVIRARRQGLIPSAKRWGSWK